MPILAKNKLANFDYEILQTYEAGVQLFGHEVKSVRNGGMNLKGAYVTMANNTPSLLNAYIRPYEKAHNLSNYDPYRTRKLLLKKKEIDKLLGTVKEKGFTLVALNVHTKNNKIKLEFGIGRGKKKFDKRQDKKEKDVKRRIKRDYGV